MHPNKISQIYDLKIKKIKGEKKRNAAQKEFK